MLHPPLVIEVTEDRRGVVGRLIGELDDSAVPVVDDYVETVSAASGGDVVLDLAAVTFIDSAAIRAMLRAQRDLAERSRTLRLQHPSRAVCRVIDLMGVQGIFTFPPQEAQQGRASLP